jgi:hypothetical protein
MASSSAGGRVAPGPVVTGDPLGNRPHCMADPAAKWLKSGALKVRCEAIGAVPALDAGALSPMLSRRRVQAPPRSGSGRSWARGIPSPDLITG